MTLEKEFQNFLSRKGELPTEVRQEAYELYKMGIKFSEIEFVIKQRRTDN